MTKIIWIHHKQTVVFILHFLKFLKTELLQDLRVYCRVKLEKGSYLKCNIYSLHILHLVNAPSFYWSPSSSFVFVTFYVWIQLPLCSLLRMSVLHVRPFSLDYILLITAITLVLLITLNIVRTMNRNLFLWMIKLVITFGSKVK